MRSNVIVPPMPSATGRLNCPPAAGSTITLCADAMAFGLPVVTGLAVGVEPGVGIKPGVGDWPGVGLLGGLVAGERDIVGCGAVAFHAPDPELHPATATTRSANTNASVFISQDSQPLPSVHNAQRTVF